VARESLRLGLEHHKTIATRLKGALTEHRMIGEMLTYSLRETYIDMMKIKIIVGTGGLLSHAPNRAQSMLIMTDAWQPEGVTKIYQDSVFMMPHLGVLSTAYPDAAWNVFDKDCLVRVGTVIAPKGEAAQGEEVVDINIHGENETIFEGELRFGEVTMVPLPERAKATAVMKPGRHFDMGAGEGKTLETTIEGGVVGVVIDTRGRPMSLPQDDEERRNTLMRWFRSLNAYPKEMSFD